MVQLDEQEQRWLSGADGAAHRFAMSLMVASARVAGADRFVPIEMAHVSSCHYSGPFSLHFAEFLLANGATLAVPTHTNASLISCSSPRLRPESATPEVVHGARRVMAIYEKLGCTAMWTCAPYQQAEGRPGFGQHVVGSESNAVGYFNSVLGARTNKYGDLLDVSAAIVGRVPYAGLHTDHGRRATHLIDLSALSAATVADRNLPHLLGAFMGRTVGDRVAAIVGLDSANEDDLKALASAAATTGEVGMFHVVGITPEARDLESATQGCRPTHHTVVSDTDLAETAGRLTTAGGDMPLRAVCLGTPHFSVAEFVETATFLGDRRVAESVTMLITTSRAVAAELDRLDLADPLAAAGVEIVLDTCTYYPPRPSGIDGLTMTNSAKWAYYGQATLDVPIAFADLERCIESAIAGRWLQ